MKWNMTNVLWALLLAAVASVTVKAQTNDNLGDYARQVRKQKAQAAPAVKKFDNDNLPANDKLSVVGQAPAPAADASTDKGDGAADAKAADGTAKPEQAAAGASAAGAPGASQQPAKDPIADKQKSDQEWQKKIQTAQGQIDAANHELDLLNREYRLRAAAFYADAGNRLRNEGSWDKEDVQFKDQIADKQKAVEAAKKALDDMQEQARKSGVPSSMRE
jgi:hypothetical protein